MSFKKFKSYATKHKLATCLWTIFAVVLIAACCIFSFGRFSHPVKKANLARSSRQATPVAQQKALKGFTANMNKNVKPAYYQYAYSPSKNTVTMKLGSSAEAKVNKADKGSQANQLTVTQVLLGESGLSKQLSYGTHDTKLGVQIIGTNGNLLFYARNGKVKYNTLPTVPSIK